jgi:aspartate carbamoyltransferase catalytic subunit
MKKLISIDDLTNAEIIDILSIAKGFFAENKLQQKDYSLNIYRQDFNAKKVINLFFEDSTRTKTSFEIAVANLGGNCININTNNSSINKGESIVDTAMTLNAMNPDFIITRHKSSGFANFFSQYINCHLVNAGDGTNEHPTQAILDLFTISQNFPNTLTDKEHSTKIIICGDVLHSRVARSNIKLLSRFGFKIKILTPATLIPKEYASWLSENWHVEIINHISDALKDGINVIMLLRIQQERMSGCYISSNQEYFENFGLNNDVFSRIKELKLENLIIMHPGPVNREVEIASNIVDESGLSKILYQVTAGVAVRQAILSFILNKSK